MKATTAAILATATALTLAFRALGATVVHSFPPTNFDADTDAMDVALGIDGFAIEDFEDTTLLPGLTIEFFKAGLGGLSQTHSELATVADPGPTFEHWSGIHLLLNHPDNDVPSEAGGNAFSKRITFHFDKPARSVGVGLIGFQSLGFNNALTDHVLLINGVPVPGTFEELAAPNYVGASRLRNGYLRIDATEATTITSIGFENISYDEALLFDHLAVRYVPEPSGAVLFILGAAIAYLKKLLLRTSIR